MRASRKTWSVVLAAGDGSRLRTLTTDRFGVTVPKQFCSVGGGPSLLRMALARAGTVAGPGRCMVVVREEHRHWWEPEVSDLPADNVIVQPYNRGTASGLVHAALQVLLQDPTGIVAVLPAGHLVEDENTLATALMLAIRSQEVRAGRLVLLGVAPDAPDTGYEWIRPGERRPGGSHRVSALVQKPSAVAAERLLREGALWNSLIFVCAAAALLRLMEHAAPHVLERFGLPALLPGEDRSHALATMFQRMPKADFSRDVLPRVARRLRVIPVPPCGWTDLGTPERVMAATRRNAHPLPATAGPIRAYRPPMDLAAASPSSSPR